MSLNHDISTESNLRDLELPFVREWIKRSIPYRRHEDEWVRTMATHLVGHLERRLAKYEADHADVRQGV